MGPAGADTDGYPTSRATAWHQRPEVELLRGMAEIPSESGSKARSPGTSWYG